MATLRGGEKLEEKLGELAKGLSKAATLRVGWPVSTAYEDGTQVGLIAAINEFGAPSRGQPPRPFMRIAIQDNSPHWPGQVASLLAASNYDATATLNLMGAEVVGQVQDSIDALMDPPLAASTIAKKGHDKPLIETNLMRSSVTFEVIEAEGRRGGWASRLAQSIRSFFGGW
jgi:hypothetical protein